MASLRRIKKDIDYLVSEVISDCWVFLYSNPDKNPQEALAIIDDAITLRNDLYSRVNHPNKEAVKAHYKGVNNDLLSGIDSLFERISAIAR